MPKKAAKRNGSTPVTGKELTEVEEATVVLQVLIEELQRKGIIDRKEHNRLVAMRLHETSKARAFEELDEEL
ncbi:MAG TPA: hypothetical protein VE130_15410 [Nitrososphaeraceae archaeon]|jgi:hypothetical protein|nr:hypothetical protein [Nitrososphaeraceae archaeon]